MDVFKKYAGFYDQLYEDKDYQKECEFIRDVLETHSTEEVTSILDLGCGTGSHALILADMGYNITGVDQSETMLDVAQEKATKKNKKIIFRRQDIRHLDLPQQFDAAIAMFAVMGYQINNSDFEDALTSVHKHLSPNGLFIFDVWFGPTVLMEKPQDRIKEIKLQDKKILRFARPTLDVVNQTVEVKYTILEVTNNKDVIETTECHFMRFFFYQELRYFLERAGFDIIHIYQFMHPQKVPDEHCWNISIISKAK